MQVAGYKLQVVEQQSQYFKIEKVFTVNILFRFPVWFNGTGRQQPMEIFLSRGPGNKFNDFD